jgi:ABC-2 type transport system ATP-binding protein
VLADAGLAQAIDRRTGGFSRGMLQRLGMAATVVGEAELLLLDEPCSALDPAGRREVLDLVKRVGRQATVLFSSHILADVQQVSDRVGVLRAGRLLYQGPLEELLVGSGVPAYRATLRERAKDVGERLRAESFITAVEVDGNDLRLRVRSTREAERGIVRALSAAGAAVVSLTPEAPDLEDVFLELTR